MDRGDVASGSGLHFLSGPNYSPPFFEPQPDMPFARLLIFLFFVSSLCACGPALRYPTGSRQAVAQDPRDRKNIHGASYQFLPEQDWRHTT
jgi:hypothetical protein